MLRIFGSLSERRGREPAQRRQHQACLVGRQVTRARCEWRRAAHRVAIVSRHAQECRGHEEAMELVRDLGQCRLGSCRRITIRIHITTRSILKWTAHHLTKRGVLWSRAVRSPGKIYIRG